MIADSHHAMAAMINARPEEVMIGPSTSMNVFLLAQALRPGLREGDEIVVTNLDHEANVGAWRKLAADGVTVREWRFDPDSMALEPEGLAALLNERTRLVCFGHCSNITGGFTDVAALARMIHDAGALACVDGVAYGAHRAIDVTAWDVDFYSARPTSSTGRISRSSTASARISSGWPRSTTSSSTTRCR